MSADANSALQQLGRRLTEARQACGFSLEQLAERLKMGPEQLQALETGNREELPEPVFVIAQSRRVATSLGIQIDEEIAALRSSDGFTTSRASRPVAPAPVVPAQAGAPARRRSPALPLVLLSLLVAAAGVLGLWRLVPRLATPPGRDPVGALPKPVSASSPAEGSVGPGPDEEPGVAELVLLPREPSWLEVRSADGATLFRGTLEEQQRFPLAAELQVLAGRPDLVEVRLGEAPATAMGSIEDVRWRRFSADPAPPP